MSNARGFLTLYFNQRRSNIESLGGRYSVNLMAQELGVSHAALSGWMAGTASIRWTSALQVEAATGGVIQARWLAKAPPSTGSHGQAEQERQISAQHMAK